MIPAQGPDRDRGITRHGVRLLDRNGRPIDGCTGFGTLEVPPQ
jgi:hypothetical protein